MDVAERIVRLATVAAGTFEPGQTIGLGSGSTAEAVVRALGVRISSDTKFIVTGVATSIRTAELARSLGIRIIDPDEVERIDIGFDGADEIDPGLNLVKGKGGALLYEKLVAEICDDYVVVSTDEKLVDRLGTRLPLPIEVIPYGWQHTGHRLNVLGLVPVLRTSGTEQYRTDAGNIILDCTPAAGIDLLHIAPQIKCVTGVVEHGIFPGLARRALLVAPDGIVHCKTPV